MIDTTQILSTLTLWTIYLSLIWGVIYAIYKLIKEKIEYNHRHNGGIKSWRTRSRRERVIVRVKSKPRIIPVYVNSQLDSYIVTR
ncbi:MAG: hypothetical protein KCHDKBKB_00688 [Elusimicrobia bacterium]|nr:hypothetical protein [Elusimicrobiota bacterium]